MANKLAFAKIQLLKRAFKANLSMEEIGKLFNMDLKQIATMIDSNPEIREMAQILPAMSRLELIEAMQTNATQNQNSTIQKFLAKNWTGMKDDIGVVNNDVKIAVVYQNSEKPQYEQKTIEPPPREKSLIDVVIEETEKLEGNG